MNQVLFLSQSNHQARNACSHPIFQIKLQLSFQFYPELSHAPGENDQASQMQRTLIKLTCEQLFISNLLTVKETQ